MAEIGKLETYRRRRRHEPARTIRVSCKAKRDPDGDSERPIFSPGEADNDARPLTRGECEQGHRPCPLVSCKYHLYLDVSRETGAIKINFPSLEVWEMRETCTLDVADQDGETLEVVGAHMNLTRERVRQIEGTATKKLRRAVRLDKRRLPLVDYRS